MLRVRLNQNHQAFETKPKNLDEFQKLLDLKFHLDLPDIYLLKIVDSNQEIKNQQDWEQLVYQQQEPIIMEIHEAHIEDLGLQKVSSSEIFGQSIFDAKKKLEELKKQFEKKEKEKNDQSPPKQKIELGDLNLEESIFQKNNSDLSISQITQYYQAILERFENNFKKQRQQHKKEQFDLYQKHFESITKRMNTKLNQYFQELGQKSMQEQKNQVYSAKTIETAQSLGQVLSINYEDLLEYVDKNKQKDISELIEDMLK